MTLARHENISIFVIYIWTDNIPYYFYIYLSYSTMPFTCYRNRRNIFFCWFSMTNLLYNFCTENNLRLTFPVLILARILWKPFWILGSIKVGLSNWHGTLLGSCTGALEHCIHCWHCRLLTLLAMVCCWYWCTAGTVLLVRMHCWCWCTAGTVLLVLMHCCWHISGTGWKVGVQGLSPSLPEAAISTTWKICVFIF